MQQMIMMRFPFMGAWIAGFARSAKRDSVAGMSRELVNEICKGYPGAEVSDPWGGGHDAWKVGGKMFALVGANDTGLFVKCPDVDTAEMLKDAGVAVKAPYFHKSWVLLPWDRVDADEIRHRIAVSYDTIRGKLPKKVQAALGPA